MASYEIAHYFRGLCYWSSVVSLSNLVKIVPISPHPDFSFSSRFDSALSIVIFSVGAIRANFSRKGLSVITHLQIPLLVIGGFPIHSCINRTYPPLLRFFILILTWLGTLDSGIFSGSNASKFRKKRINHHIILSLSCVYLIVLLVNRPVKSKSACCEFLLEVQRHQFEAFSSFSIQSLSLLS